MINKEILLNILKLDSIFGFLDWTERVDIHQIRLARTTMTTFKVALAYEIVKENDWTPPEMKVKDDRLTYYLSFDGWKPIEEYAKNHPVIKEAVKELKN